MSTICTRDINYQSSGDHKRETFFEVSLKRLLSASTGGFGTLRNQCKVELELYNFKYCTVIVSARADKFDRLKEHPYSVSIQPSEYAMYAPVDARGDENCLYVA